MEISTFVPLLDHLESVEDKPYCLYTKISSSLFCRCIRRQEDGFSDIVLLFLKLVFPTEHLYSLCFEDFIDSIK